MSTFYLNKKNKQIILNELQSIILEKLKTKKTNKLINFFKDEIINYYDTHFLKDIKVLEKYKLSIHEFDIIELVKRQNIYNINFNVNKNWYNINNIYIQLDQKRKIPHTANKIRFEIEIDEYLVNNYLKEYEQLNSLYENIVNKTEDIMNSFSVILSDYRTWNQLIKNHPEFNIVNINKLFPELNNSKKNKLKNATKNIKEFNKLLEEEK